MKLQTAKLADAFLHLSLQSLRWGLTAFLVVLGIRLGIRATSTSSDLDREVSALSQKARLIDLWNKVYPVGEEYDDDGTNTVTVENPPE